MDESGNWPLQERRVRGWSQAELARRAGVSRPTISNYESGKTKHPTPGVIQAIARAMNIPLEDAFCAMGLLSPKTERTLANVEFNILCRQLLPDDQSVVRDIILAFLKRAEKIS